MWRPKRERWRIFGLTAGTILFVCVGLGWLFSELLPPQQVALTPAQELTHELANYARFEKPLGRRGAAFYNAVFLLAEHRMKWTEAQVVDALGAPDGMQRRRSGVALVYKFGDGDGSVKDQIAVIQINWGVVALIGFNSLSSDDQFPWAPYQPPSSTTTNALGPTSRPDAAKETPLH